MSRIIQAITSEGLIEHCRLKSLDRMCSGVYRDTQQFYAELYDLVLNQQSTNNSKEKGNQMELKVEQRRNVFRIIVKGQRRIATNHDGNALDQGGYETEKKAVNAAKRIANKTANLVFVHKDRRYFQRSMQAAGK